MNKEKAVQPVTDAAKDVDSVQPVVKKKVAAEPKKQAAPAAATVARKLVAKKPAVKEMAEKPAPTPRKIAKPVVKAPAAAPKTEKPAKARKQAPKKPKLIRDSFTIPESDYVLFATLKQRALASGVEVKKGEVLRAALVMLAKLNDAELIKAFGLVERIKTGRPKK